MEHPAHGCVRRARRHLRPRSAPLASPPDPDAPQGQYGFTFDRLGIHLPAIAVSPWIDERTVINGVHHHTSVIRTLRERWDLGGPLTQRDAEAPDLALIFTRDEPRRPEDWPDVHPQPVPEFDESLIPLDKPLSPLAKAIVGAVLAVGFAFVLRGYGGGRAGSSAAQGALDTEAARPDQA